MKLYPITLWLLACCVSSLSCTGWCDSPSDQSCLPSAELRAQLEKAADVGITNPYATEPALAPFRTLRDRYPDEISAHEGYQDAVQRYGVEGQLKSLTEEYRTLDVQHDGSRMYHYLYLRSLVGYSTGAALQGLTEMVAQAPDFAPAHQTLAGIYGSATFHDAAKEKLERAKLLLLCPGTAPTQTPPTLPGPSLLLDQAERLLAQHGASDRILAMTAEGISQEEWRWQHIHPHDWYSDDDKRSTLRDLRASYWKAWSIQVRCYRSMGHTESADDLLARMDGAAMSFLNEPGRSYWNAMATLVQLYAEAGQKDQASQKLRLMTALLARKPDPGGTAQIKALETLIRALSDGK